MFLCLALALHLFVFWQLINLEAIFFLIKAVVLKLTSCAPVTGLGIESRVF